LSTGEIETTADDTDEAKITKRWLRELSLSSTHEAKWRKRAQKVIERYRDEEAATDEDKRTPRFNILYANTEVLRGVIYQKTPTADVRRRFIDKDPVGRIAAQTLQRSLSFCVDAYHFDGVMEAAVEDYLLPGRCFAKVKYVPTFGPVIGQDGQPMMDEAGQPAQQVVSETVEAEYIEWDMVRISPAKRWAKVRWVAFGELLTRDDLVKQFGEDIGKRCTLDWSSKDKEEEKDEMFKRALVWTIWDKTARKVHVVSKGLPEQRLAVKDDPLGLKDFFPCPKPVYSVTTTGSMIPIPEYTQYQDQALELDNLTARIDVLVDALRRRGVYNGNYAELGKLATAGDNEFIPVEKYSELVEKGIESAIWEAPIEVLAKVVAQLMAQRESIKQIIYEVTGLADVVRGVSKSSETLGAQELKARYANSRTGPRQKAIQVFARDLFRLKAEIIAEKFSPQTLAQITGFDLAMNDQEKQTLQTQAQAAEAAGQKIDTKKLTQPTWEQVMALLRDDKLRGFRVDIETDSTVQPDAAEEQKNRIELLSAITQFVEGVAPAVQSGAVSMELAKEMLSFGVRGFKVSPQLEDALDAMGGDQQEQGPSAEQIKQQGLQMQQKEQELRAREAEIQGAEQKFMARKVELDQREMKAQFAEKIAQIQSDYEKAADNLEAESATREAISSVKAVVADHEQRVKAMVDGIAAQAKPSEPQEEAGEKESESAAMMQQIAAMHAEMLGQVQQVIAYLAAPKKRTAVRGADGRMQGMTEELVAFPDGRGGEIANGR